MKNRRCWVCIAMLAFAGMAHGSGEGDIPVRIERVDINAFEAGYSFRFSMDKKESLDRIEVKWGGKAFDFAPKHFGKVESVYIRGVRIKAPTAFSGGRQDSVIVVLPRVKSWIRGSKLQ